MQSIFMVIAFTSIAIGGILSAFRAKRPDRKTMWVSAYLVLITGLSQLGLTVAIPTAANNVGSSAVLVLMVSYNIGSLAVIFGTIYKNVFVLVNLASMGSLLVTLSVLELAVSAYGSEISWQIILFYIVSVVLVASSLIGAKLAYKNKIS